MTFTTTLFVLGMAAQSDLLQYSIRHSLSWRHDFVQFAADGTRAIALNGERFERIDLADGTSVGFAAPPAGKARLVAAASRDLTRLMAGSGDGTVHFLQPDGFAAIHRAHKGRVTAVAVSPDGALSASAGADKRILIWDYQARNIRHSFVLKEPAVFLMFRSPANSVVGVTADGSIQEWDANSGKVLRQMQDPDGAVHAAAINASGNLLVLGTEFSALTKGNPMRAAHPSDFHRENRLRVYDLSRGASVKEIGQVQGQVRSISVSPDGRFAAATRHRQRDAFFAIFDLVRGVEISSAQIPLDSMAIDFAPDGRWLASPLQDGRLGVFAVTGVQRGNTAGDLAGQKIVLTSSNAQPVFPAGQARQSVAVMDFDARNLNADTGAAIADMLRNRLAGTPQLELIDRGRIEKIFAEQNIQNSDRVDSRNAVRLGRILNVQKMIFGSVTQFGASFTINAQVVDIETSRIDGIREVLCQRCQIDDLPQAAAVLGGAMLER